MRLELHCHSTCSDGTTPPDEVARLAHARGAEIFCLTDHDTSRGYPATCASGGDMRVLRGLELSCSDAGRTVHVLVYDIAGDERWSMLEAELERVRARRVARVRDMGARLAQRGIHIDTEAIIARAGERPVGRPDVARAMVAVGAVKSMSDAFKRFLGDRGSLAVPPSRLPVEDALALGRQVGARMSLAHPHTLGDHAEVLLARHRDAGLDAVEAFYGAYDAGERARWIAVAERLGLVVTGGSDFHGANNPAVSAPCVTLPAPWASRLQAWLS